MIDRASILCDAQGVARTEGIALAHRLQALAGARTLEERLDAWSALDRWTAGQPARPLLLVAFLEENADVREKVQAAVGEIFGEADGVNLFAEAGMPSHRGFVLELWRRLLAWVLPTPRDDHDLGRFLLRQFRRDAEPGRFRQMDPAFFARRVRALFPFHHPHLGRLRASFGDAFRLLAARAAAAGLSADLRARSVPGPVTDSPFYLLPAASDRLAALWLNRERTALLPAAESWRETAAAARRALGTIKDRLETEGVSVEIVYSITVIEQALARMTRMAEVMVAEPGAAHAAALQALFADLAEAARADTAIGGLLAASTSLLHRKIVERSGSTGKHYIAGDGREYRHLWLAAIGGGLLTTLTAAIKMTVAHAALPLFVIGLLSGLNYAVSFLLLQLFGLVLATKQPAMTAAHLARIIRDTRGGERSAEITGFFAQISRSQLAAAIGNVTAVAAGAYAFNAAWYLLFGHDFLADGPAGNVFHDLSPLNSGTLFFACLTGVLLWLASVVGGWVDNFSVYHRLPQAIRDHPWREVLGRERLARWGDLFARNVSGWGTNIALGFLLGMTPVIGVFLGLPLQVRHVTLSTGQLALATATFHNGALDVGWLLRGVAGIAAMFVLNLGVSFLLSLFTAARAYRLRPREVAFLLGEIGRGFLRAPGEFLLPPRHAPAPGEVTSAEIEAEGPKI